MALVPPSFISIERTSFERVSNATLTMSLRSASRSLNGTRVHPAQFGSSRSSLSQHGSCSRSQREPSPRVTPSATVMVAGTALRNVMMLVVDVSST